MGICDHSFIQLLKLLAPTTLLQSIILHEHYILYTLSTCTHEINTLVHMSARIATMPKINRGERGYLLLTILGCECPYHALSLHPV